MSQNRYSIKMRASRQEAERELHVSGAEKIVEEERITSCCDHMIERALHHAKGTPDFINLKIETVKEAEITWLNALPVTTREVSDAKEGLCFLKQLLADSGIERVDEIMDLLKETYAMRGAMLLNVDTLERLEENTERGIRATYMDLVNETDSRREKNHFKEALVLATKVSHHPCIIGEICISDDPDYVTGYFASKEMGYVRITKLKQMGSPDGGRIFLFRGNEKDAKDCIHYLEKEKVLVKFPEELKQVNGACLTQTKESKWKKIDDTLDYLQENHLFRKMTVMESAQGKYVMINGEKKLLFSSNAYLDLCNDEIMKEKTASALMQYGVGSGGSRLTTGSCTLHQALEEKIASFKKREAAIVFNTGYMANVGAISAIASKEDVIFSDELNHASIIDGCRLSGAKIVVYKHNDMEDLEKKVQANQGKSGLIVSDGVFSMDGDIVNLPELVRIAEKYQLFSMIDEAHSTGVIGAHGGGVEEHYHMEGSVDILMGTLSKAIGVEGGFVCGSQKLIDFLVNKARSFIFATSMTPMNATAALAGMERLEESPELVWHLQKNVVDFCKLLQENGVMVSSQTAIIPIIIGSEERAMKVMEELKEMGYFISAIRYPTVAKGSARLRVALMSSHTYEELAGLAKAIKERL